MKNINILIIFLNILILLQPLTSAAYTFNEDILQECGKKHPNDFIGRFVCNNRLETNICLSGEVDRIEKKVQKINNLIEDNDTAQLEDVFEKIKQLNVLSAPLLANTSKDNGKDKVIVGIIKSTCSDRKYYLININENEEKIITNLRVWLVDKNKEDKSENNSELINEISWELSPYKLSYIRNKIYRLEVIKKCKINAIEKYKLVNAELDEFISNQKKLVAKDIINKLNKDYEIKIEENDDNPSVNLNKKSIKISPSCPDKKEDLVLTYNLYHSNGYVNKVDGSILYTGKIKLEIARPFLWESEDLFLQKKADEERLSSEKKEAIDKISRENKENVLKILLISLASLLLISIIFFTFKRLFLKKQNPKTDELSNPLKRIFLQSKEETNSHSTSTEKSEQDLVLINEFRSKHPFVKVDVPPQFFNQFLQECSWLEDKLGSPPDKVSQESILESIINSNI